VNGRPSYPVEKLMRIDTARIIKVHAVSIRYGKTFSTGVKNEGSLDRVADEIHKMAKGRKDSSLIVARAMELLVKDHPFWDGNHRTAFELGRLICLFFDYRLDVTVEEAVAFMRNIDYQDMPLEKIQKWVDERRVAMKVP
jgi:death-on-curing family protein